MVSFRFPFSFSQTPAPSIPAAANASCRRISFTAVSIASGISLAGASIAVHRNPNGQLLNTLNPFRSRGTGNYPMCGSLSLSGDSSPVIESRTGMSFPVVLRDCQRLLGVGMRRKTVLGLKNIDVYAFGVYADDADVKRCLCEKYGDIPVKGNEKLPEDLMECDVRMTIRLQIVYGKLSIRSVRSAFEESVGDRLQRFGGSGNKDLLQRFTSQFKDEYKIPKGSMIDLSKEEGYVLRTTIDGNEVGSIESKLLCQSILDLYIGNEPFDRKAKEDVELNLAALVTK